MLFLAARQMGISTRVERSEKSAQLDPGRQLSTWLVEIPPLWGSCTKLLAGSVAARPRFVERTNEGVDSERNRTASHYRISRLRYVGRDSSRVRTGKDLFYDGTDR